VYAPKLWNSLPAIIRDSVKLHFLVDAFKHSLKTELFGELSVTWPDQTVFSQSLCTQSLESLIPFIRIMAMVKPSHGLLLLLLLHFVCNFCKSRFENWHLQLFKMTTDKSKSIKLYFISYIVVLFMYSVSLSAVPRDICAWNCEEENLKSKQHKKPLFFYYVLLYWYWCSLNDKLSISCCVLLLS